MLLDGEFLIHLDVFDPPCRCPQGMPIVGESGFLGGLGLQVVLPDGKLEMRGGMCAHTHSLVKFKLFTSRLRFLQTLFWNLLYSWRKAGITWLPSVHRV